jgi:hypothetical protein
VASLSYGVGGEEVGFVRCDGLVVATPAGSTGYNLANGGPVLAWGVEGYVVSFIAPHSLTARALVVAPGDELQVCNRGDGEVDILIDGRPVGCLAPGDAIATVFVRQAALLAQAPGLVVLPAPAGEVRAAGGVAGGAAWTCARERALRARAVPSLVAGRGRRPPVHPPPLVPPVRAPRARASRTSSSSNGPSCAWRPGSTSSRARRARARPCWPTRWISCLAPGDQLQVCNRGDGEVDISVDGRPVGVLEPGEVITTDFVRRAALLAQAPGSSFYLRLREKFGRLAA